MKRAILNTVIFIASVASWPTLASNVDEAATFDKPANMVIYRPFDDSAINYRISVDGKHIGKLKRKTALNLALKPGEHTIAVNDAKYTTLVVPVNAQEITYIDVHIDRKSRLSLTPIEPTEQTVATLFNKR